MAVPAVVEGYMESIFLPIVLLQIGRADLQPNIRDAGGVTKFWPIAVRYNEAGTHRDVLGLGDLEQGECAPTLLLDKLQQNSARFHIRIAVRMLESWLIADRARLASFLRAPIAAVPVNPDLLQHPKQELVNIARRSTRKSVREAMVPEDSGGMVGPDYVATMSDFMQNHWRVAEARIASPSLERACVRWAAI